LIRGPSKFNPPFASLVPVVPIERERPERNRQPEPARFQIRFLQRPELEKAARLFPGREAAQSFQLAAREYSFGQARRMFPRDVLHVDAHVAAVGHRACCEALGVRKIEAQR
jgi:hypothetical protein